MKQNRKKLIAVQLFAALGNAVVGIFLPFLFGRAFNLTTSQIILGMAGLQLLMLLSVYFLNQFWTRFKSRNVVRMGLVLQALFLMMLALAPSTIGWAISSVVVYVLFLVTYWPSWHMALLHSSKDGTRGNFTGNIQIMMVGANLIAPLLSGWFLDRGWDNGVLALSGGMFVIAIVLMQDVELPQQKLSSFSSMWRVFRDDLWNTKHRWGVITDGVQSGTLWILWPIFLGAALGSFTQMGLVVALAALVEVASAKYFGSFTDRKSARKALNLGQWFRFWDMGLRGFLMLFPSLLMAGMVTIAAGILGPVFNISLYSRTCEIAEKSDPKQLEWFLAREWVLGASRFLWMMCGALAVYWWGDMVLGWFLVGAAVASIGFRKY
jgi:MFS family permease